ncbi:MAG: outer membrane protein assembly factor BamA, partial [Pseudomonadota bacterium]
DQEDFYITFTIDEGVKYDYGEVRVETALEKLSSDALTRILPIRQGTLYRSDQIETAIDAITFAAGSAGYASVDVRPRVETNPETRTVDITFVVDEGPRVYIERIDITGNTQTLDRVIRREIRIAEGDAFNRILLDQSRNRIRSLGFFKEVEITEAPGSTADRTVVNVNVEETATGELAFSAGFSSADAFLFSLSASQRNLRGRGQFLSARIQTTSRQQDLEFRFTEPRFQDRNLAAGVDLYATQADFLDEAGFENQSLGAGLRLNFPIGERTSLGLNYRLRQDDVQVSNPEVNCGIDTDGDGIGDSIDVDGDGIGDGDGDGIGDEPIFFRSSLCDQLGVQLTSAVGYSLSRDRRNDPITPTRGYRATFSQEVAGAGGDVNYLRNEFRGSFYRGILPGWTASASLDAGFIEGWNGDNVRVNNRFFKGGNSFRGFDVAGLGPREVITTVLTEDANNDGVLTPVLDENGEQIVNITSGNALGGKAYAIGALELSFPVPYAPEEFGIGGALFSEFGTVGLLDDVDRNRSANTEFQSFRVDDSASLRASVGVSIFWDSPFGPIRFDFSEVLAKEDYDRTESFRFSTNTQF